MKENFSNLEKEIDFRGVQEAQRVPKKLGPRRNTPRYIIITLPKMKEKERNFFKNIFIDYAITVVPFPTPLTPLHPAHPLPPTFPPIVHVHGSYL